MKFAFFDLDNTLTDRRATVSAYADYFLSEFRECLKNGVSIEHLSSAFNELDKGGYEAHEIRSAAISTLDIWRNPKAPEELSSHWQNWVPANALPMKGMAECLKEMLEMDFRLCLVSNGQSKNQRDKVKKLSLDSYFEKIVISEEVGYKKPDSRIFRLALKEMDCRAEESFFIGDHPANDYMGSTELGFTGIWIEGAHPWPGTHDKPLSIRNLSELCPLVRSLTGKGVGPKNARP